jgi:hypothetical protein
LVLIEPVGDHVRMAPFLLVGLLLLVVVLAPLYGADSRLDEIGRRRKLHH